MDEILDMIEAGVAAAAAGVAHVNKKYLIIMLRYSEVFWVC